MGKSLKGKELGIGITQRQDGLYQARFTNRFGKRETLPPLSPADTAPGARGFAWVPAPNWFLPR